MAQKNIFVACTYFRDVRELGASYFKQNYNIYFQEYDGLLDKVLLKIIKKPSNFIDPNTQIESLVQLCQQNTIEGVVSTDDYPGCNYSSIIAYKLGLPGPSPASVLTCQHKYYCRVMQKQLVPEATPDFKLIDPSNFSDSTFSMSFPIFVKPIKAHFSIYANKLSNLIELKNALNNNIPPHQYLEQFNFFLRNYSFYELTSNYLIAEELLEGIQVTLEGYVYNNEINIMGIVDSIMFPGTICFERFEYPSNLPLSVQERMIEISKRFIQGIKLNNTLFSIEYMYNPVTDQLWIIEVNPRMSNQFADLFEKVNGINSYQILLDLSVGKNPCLQSKQGKYKFACSFILRLFENKRLLSIPSKQDLEIFYNFFPDARIEILLQPGERLDSIKQDGKSYRYGLIHLGSNSKEELMEKYQFSLKILPFVFD